MRTHLVVLQTVQPLLLPPPSLHPSILTSLSYARTLGATYISPYLETSHPALLCGRYYSSIPNSAPSSPRRMCARGSRVTQTHAASACHGPATCHIRMQGRQQCGTTWQRHNSSTHTGRGERGKKTNTQAHLGLKPRPSPPRRTPSLTLTQHLISQVPNPSRMMRRERERERGRWKGEEGMERREGGEGWRTMVTQFVSAG